MEYLTDYFLNADLYYRLWMVANLQNEKREPSSPGRLANFIGMDATVTWYRQNWLPELIEQFDNIDMVPDEITVTSSRYSCDDMMRFHTGNKYPSIQMNKMIISWMHDSKRKIFYRENGPACISFENLRMWHHQNVHHRRRGDAVLCESGLFTWNTEHGSRFKSHRTDGPAGVYIQKFRANMKHGEMRNMGYKDLDVTWGNESGIRNSSSHIENIIRMNNIDLNYLRTGSVFENPMEEFIFWDEVGNSQ
jgi:hypothetical protein